MSRPARRRRLHSNGSTLLFSFQYLLTPASQCDEAGVAPVFPPSSVRLYPTYAFASISPVTLRPCPFYPRLPLHRNLPWHNRKPLGRNANRSVTLRGVSRSVSAGGSRCNGRNLGLVFGTAIPSFTHPSRASCVLLFKGLHSIPLASVKCRFPRFVSSLFAVRASLLDCM